ncbi:MAG: hypothetical protein H6729_01975 [Deltaproteobacteria bacterium]|nr:hypothetical protein [Deltaproteobacteria bacterium]
MRLSICLGLLSFVAFGCSLGERGDAGLFVGRIAVVHTVVAAPIEFASSPLKGCALTALPIISQGVDVDLPAVPLRERLGSNWQ